MVLASCVWQILSPWREPPAPEREAFITFWVNRDTHVHVCMDSRTPPSKLPSWLEYAGFRKKPVRGRRSRCCDVMPCFRGREEGWGVRRAFCVFSVGMLSWTVGILRVAAEW